MNLRSNKVVNVIPLNELRIHMTDLDCLCKPIYNEDNVIIHFCFKPQRTRWAVTTRDE